MRARCYGLSAIGYLAVSPKGCPLPSTAHIPPIELARGRWGQGADLLAKPVALPDARRYVRELAGSGRENFHVLTRLVPPAWRDDFAAVYAFCRWADDLGDEHDPGATPDDARPAALSRLAWWRSELHACFDGRAAHPVFVALRPTAEALALPREPFDHLIDAFEQDQRVTRYRTWDELLDYCTRSANPVGRLVLALGRAPVNEEHLRESDAVCTTLQLANFWQDVRSDLLDRDRVYLPLELTGLDAGSLRDMAERSDDPACRVRFIKALRPLVERTAALLDEGRQLPERVAPGLRAPVWLFVAAADRLLRAVEAEGCTTLWRRPRIGRATRAGLFLRACVMASGARARAEA